MNDDGTVNQELIELVLRQISAVQSSMIDIDMKAIAVSDKLAIGNLQFFAASVAAAMT